jgi:GDP-4-dehydro-6-deoxy-D-mannose reductase
VKALVAGAAGFCGQHLVSHLLQAGHDVSGLDCTDRVHPGAAIYKADIHDVAGVQAVLHTVQPDLVFHLAALTNPRLDYRELHRVNALGTLILLDAVRRVCPAVTIVVTSSSAVYGRGPGGALPIGEDQPLLPANLYAVSKIAQEMVAYQQFAAHGLRVIRTRAFNLTGPGESAGFVTSAFARQIAEIETGRRPPILYVGNLDAVRDFTDVRDAVRAYRLLAEQGRPGAVYNVCSGQGTRIRQLLDDLLALAGFPGIQVQPDPDRLQPADVPIQIGDATRLLETTGWLPEIPLRQTLLDVLDHWRRRIDEEG